MKRVFLLIACAALLAALAGCGQRSNLVALEYIPVRHGEGLCTRPVAVGAFLDMREHQDLGRDAAHVLYPERGTAAQWVADAMALELAAGGCEVVRDDKDSPFNPELTVRGEILRLSVVRDGFDYVVDMELAVKLFRGTEMLQHKVYSGRWQDVYVKPSKTRFRDLLRQSLQETLGRAVADLRGPLGAP